MSSVAGAARAILSCAGVWVALLVTAPGALASSGAFSQMGIPTRACISDDGLLGLCQDGRGLYDAEDAAVSKDGKSVYVASNGGDALTVFSRNITTGALTQLSGTQGCISETGAGGCADGVGLDGPFDVAISADGRSVYVASVTSDSVAVFSRNTTTGALTQLPGTAGCLSGTGAAGCASALLTVPAGIAVSGDGKSVYVTSAEGHAITAFARQTTTTGGTLGALTPMTGAAGCVHETGNAGLCADGRALLAPIGVAVSADGKSVYVTSVESNAVAVFARQTTTTGGALGKLTQLAGSAGCVSEAAADGCADGVGLGFPAAVAASPDGKSAYVASAAGTVTSFIRQTATTGGTLGRLTQLGLSGCISETGGAGCDDGRGLAGAWDVVVTPDSKSVYVAGLQSGAVAAFARQTTTTDGTQGRLTQLPGTAGCVSDTGADGCADGSALDDTAGIAVSADNKSVYVVASVSDAVSTFARQLTATATAPQGKLSQLDVPSPACVSENGSGGVCADGRGVDNAVAAAMSKDGKSLYLVAPGLTDTLSVFTRNTTTGLVTQPAGVTGCTSDTGAGGCVDGTALSDPRDVAVSADGKSVYVVSATSSAVAVFARNTTTGALTQLTGAAGCVSETGADGCADGRALGTATGVAVSADGKSVYVSSAFGDGSGAVAVFARNLTTGALTQLAGTAGCISEAGTSGCADGSGLAGANDVTVSADGKSVYAVATTSDAVTAFARQTTAGTTLGKLTQLPGTARCVSETGAGGCADGNALDGPTTVVATADNKSVYVAAYNSDAIVSFARQTTTTAGTLGKLTQLVGTAGCFAETAAAGCRNGAGLDGVYGVTVSADGKSVHAASDAGATSFTRQTGTTPGELGQLIQEINCVAAVAQNGCAVGLNVFGARGIVVSANGRSVYTASFQGLAAFAREL